MDVWRDPVPTGLRRRAGSAAWLRVNSRDPGAVESIELRANGREGGELLEGAEACGDLVFRHGKQALHAEVLDRERGHRAPVDERPAQALVREVARAREVAHHPPREAVPGTGRIDDGLEGHARRREDALAVEH